MKKLSVEGHQNPFTELVAPKGSSFQNIFDGISKSLSVKISIPMGPILISAGFNPEDEEKPGEISLKIFNRIARSLLKEHCQKFQFYFFIDELVFSRLDARDDEITLRAAMVRDILRCAWELNSFSSQNGLAFHFVCSLRPEIRNLISDYDSESGKFLDGKDVELSWLSTDGSDGRLILDVLQAKVSYSYFRGPEFETFFAQFISFGAKTDSIQDFLVTNTWGRPRDVVRLLLSIQKKSPNAIKIGENEIKAALDDYSRASSRELIDELGVSYGQKILSGLRSGIRKKTYSSKQEFLDVLSASIGNLASTRLIDEFFELGLICGYQKQKGYYFWAHRGETYLKDHHAIRIHPALWNDFSIRDL